jgi:protoporphyrinogen oxidase
MSPKERLEPAIVIGAGPAGMAFACRYIQHGGKVTVVEASKHVGGLARSFELWGSTVDLGPHRFFSADPEVNKYWHAQVAEEFTMVNRLTRIYYQGKFYNYPLQAFNALKNLGLRKAFLSVHSYILCRIFPPKQDGSLEKWVISKFGSRLFKTFFKNYTEKVWGIDCKDIDADWASQRIQGLTLWGAIKSALFLNKKNELKTLIDEFAYPKNGNSVFYEKQKDLILRSENKIVFEDPVVRIQVENSRVKGIQLKSGEYLKTSLLVSTMPLTQLISGMENVPENVVLASRGLKFRNTILVYLQIDAMNLFNDQWLYIHDPKLLHGRITNFNNWSKEIVGDESKTILCMEFWCFETDSIWDETEEELIELAKRELVSTGLCRSGEILKGKVIKIKKSYPVYNRGYKDKLVIVQSFLDTIQGLHPIGRYGSFKYNNQDHSILMGLVAADSVAKNLEVNLWDINTESTYQESASSLSLREIQP